MEKGWSESRRPKVMATPVSKWSAPWSQRQNALALITCTAPGQEATLSAGREHSTKPAGAEGGPFSAEPAGDRRERGTCRTCADKRPGRALLQEPTRGRIGGGSGQKAPNSCLGSEGVTGSSPIHLAVEPLAQDGDGSPG